MNKLFFSIVFLILFGKISLGNDAFLKTQTFMQEQEVMTHFGNEPFDAVKFKNGNEKTRSPQAFRIIKDKIFVGKPTSLVFEKLGKSTGFFWNKNIPAYLLNSGWKTKETTWQLIFLIDENGIVTQPRVHRNCCDK